MRPTTSVLIAVSLTVLPLACTGGERGQSGSPIAPATPAGTNAREAPPAGAAASSSGNGTAGASGRAAEQPRLAPSAGSPAEPARKTPAMASGSQGSAADSGGMNDAGAEDPRPNEAEPVKSPVDRASGPTPVIPKPNGPCPTFRTGRTSILGMDVEIYAGPPSPTTKGPLIFYWHGNFATGAMAVEGVTDETLLASVPEELLETARQIGKIPDEVREEILAEGGIIVAPDNSTMNGIDTTFVSVWHAGDFEFADLVAGCAVDNHNIDPRRIYVTGCSAGGLMSSAMVYQRSSYLAAAVIESGGLAPDVGLDMFQDPTHIPAVMTTHGNALEDIVPFVVAFADLTETLNTELAAAGGFAINCDHGGGHCMTPEAFKVAAWQFMKDHPFGVSPDPYSAVPPSFPSYCKVVK